MADVTDQHDQTSPTDLDDHAGNGASGAAESRGIKRARPSTADDDDDDDEKGNRERRKIEIKFISDKSRRHITFSKRKAGIMKKVRASIRIVINCQARGSHKEGWLQPPVPACIASASRQQTSCANVNLRNRRTSCRSSRVHKCYFS